MYANNKHEMVIYVTSFVFFATRRQPTKEEKKSVIFGTCYGVLNLNST